MKKALIVIDPALFRPVDIDALCGDAVSFHAMVKEMVEADCAAAATQL
jgi:GDP-D-mannose dehydratase